MSHVAVEPDDVNHRLRRLSIEEPLIAVYRGKSGENTTADFGRITESYKRSSRRADRFKECKISERETETNTATGVRPLPWTDTDELMNPSWMGFGDRTADLV